MGHTDSICTRTHRSKSPNSLGLSILRQASQLRESSIYSNISTVCDVRDEYIASVLTDVVSGVAIDLPLVAWHVIERNVPIWVSEGNDGVDEFGSSWILSAQEPEGVVDDLGALAVARYEKFGAWALVVGLDNEL